MAYLFVLLVNDTPKLVDGGVGFCELLLANGCALADSEDEPEGDGLGSAVDVDVDVACDHAKEGFGRAR